MLNVNVNIDHIQTRFGGRFFVIARACPMRLLEAFEIRLEEAFDTMSRFDKF
jgi:hypothetical protein